MSEEGRGDAFSLPHLLIALGVILTDAILITVWPLHLFRYVIGVAALFASGYCALALVAGDSLTPTLAETLAYTTGLTIIVTAASALLVSALGIPITGHAILILGVPLAVLAVLRAAIQGRFRSDLPHHFRNLFDFSDYRLREKAVAWVLLGAVVVLGLSLVGLALSSFLLLRTSVTGVDQHVDWSRMSMA